MADKKSKIDSKLFRRIVQLTNPYKFLLYVCLFLAVILAPISIVSPFLVKLIVDKHIITGDITGIGTIIIFFVFFVLLNVALRYLFIYQSSLLGQLIIKDLRVRVFRHISSLRLGFFDRTAVGTATTRTINDVETMNTVFSQGFITIIADILGIIAIVGVMFYTSWQLTLICLTTLPFLILATYIFKERVKSAFQVVRTEVARMNAFLQERITGMKIVQIFNAEEQEMVKFKKINRSYTQANLDSIFYYAVFFPVVELISAVGLALLIWWGTRSYLADSVTFGALVAFPMYLSMLFRPVRMLADKFNTLQMGLVAADRIYSVLDDRSQIPDEGTHEADLLKGEIEFKNVFFSYDGKNDVIKDLNLKIEPGKTLAIVGSTGSGKTTIINILSRFYEIQKGNILVDNVDVTDYKLQNLRSHISIVLQDVFLFNGTVYENICLKDKMITLDQVKAAAEIIGADEYINMLPGGYDFKITERGLNLSVGQRQLISFARALVFNPNILILDEATSSIDTQTEAIIQNAIEKLISKRTSIIIAHRLTTIRHADQILVMDQGRMIECGSHEELLQIENGKYKELYEMQFVDAIEEVH